MKRNKIMINDVYPLLYKSSHSRWQYLNYNLASLVFLLLHLNVRMNPTWTSHRVKNSTFNHISLGLTPVDTWRGLISFHHYFLIKLQDSTIWLRGTCGDDSFLCSLIIFGIWRSLHCSQINRVDTGLHSTMRCILPLLILILSIASRMQVGVPKKGEKLSHAVMT